MQILPYLFFGGRTEEALEFYRKAIGGEVAALHRFSDMPDQGMVPPGAGNKVMHGHARLGGGELLASDGDCEGPQPFSGFSLSLMVDSVEEGQRVFKALAEGGKVDMAFGPQFWSPGYGQLTDRFGVSWMVNVTR
jgi:PhnB protein